jgi:hypothetical protein
MAENSESITCQELEASLFSARRQILASCYCGAEDCTCFDARRAEYDANTSSAIFLRLLEAQKKAKATFKSPVVKISAPKDCTCQPDEESLAQCGEPVPPPRLNLQGGVSQGEYDEGASPHIPVVPGPPPPPKPPTPLNLLPGYNTPQEADNGAATPVLFAQEEDDDTPILSPTLIPNQNLEELD